MPETLDALDSLLGRFRPDEAYALELDSLDPLRGFRERFLLPPGPDGRPLVYLAGNSLGLQPRSVRAVLERELEDWAKLGVAAHDHGRTPWYTYHRSVTEPLARLVGAAPSEVVAMNTLTVNLHLLMVTFYRPTPDRFRILLEARPFPSDLYAAQTQLRHHGYDSNDGIVFAPTRPGEHTTRTEDFERLLDERGESIALVLLGGVNYFTGQAFDMERIAAAARRRGCVVGLDLAHAAGNVPLRLHDWDVDFAAWCTYKYLNAGPGAVAAAFVHERHARNVDLPRFGGWWGNDPATRFQMHLTTRFVPLPSADGWQLSNPPVLALAPLRASLALFEEAGMESLRAKSMRLTAYLDRFLGRDSGGRLETITPADPAERGCQTSLLRSRPSEGALRVTGLRGDPGGLPGAERDSRGAHPALQLVPRHLEARSRVDRGHRGGGGRASLRGAMSASGARRFVIVGGGLGGALLATHLGQAGHEVELYERRPDPRTGRASQGRSINLAISTRGIHALEKAGLAGEVLRSSVAMKGRMIHGPRGTLSYQPYGTREDQAIHSVSRADLNRILIEAARAIPGVRVVFGKRCTGVDLETATATFEDLETSERSEARGDAIVGSDGAFSVVRREMQKLDRFEFSQTYLGHGYKELSIPPGPGGSFAMERNALHIWPRGGFMMIALPNHDGSYTCTCFWPFDGAQGFSAHRTGEDVVRYFGRVFPDSVPLLPSLAEDYFENPTGALVTIRCWPWHLGGRAVLLGDACHAVVPFYGQGANAAFEDCTALSECIEASPDDLERAFVTYSARRKPNVDALADLAVENFLEMRDKTASRAFLFRKRAEKALHRLFPSWYLPLYSMVSFSTIPYAEARRRAAWQDRAVLGAAGGLAAVLAAAAAWFVAVR